MVHLFLFVLVSGLLQTCALSQASTQSSTIPNPFGNDTGSYQSWTIKSKRTFGSKETGLTQLIAEEHYLIGALKATYHGHLSIGSQSFVLASRNGKVYEAVKPEDKKNEAVSESHQRCSPLHSVIKWPWRYQSKNDKDFMVLGIGAVWLNALDMAESFKCTQVNDLGLKCIMMNSRRYDVELNFNKESNLVSGYVQEKVDSSGSKPKPSKIEFQVDVLKDFVDEKASEEVENLLALCELASNVRFPSLLSEMLDTRFWSFSYVLRNFDAATGNKFSEYSIREEFNYEQNFQGIFKYSESAGMEVYLRNMSMHWTFDGKLRTMTYKIVNRICTVSQFENGILSGDAQIHMTKRRLHFRNEHRGFLIGVSALLMNMGDIRNKRVAIEGTIADDNWIIEWMISEGSSFQWYLIFPGQVYKNNQALSNQWTRLELRKTVERGGGKGSLIASFEQVKYIIELSDVPSLQYFELPSGCPQEVDYNHEDEVAEVEIKDEKQKDALIGEVEEKFEFPLLDQILNLEESFLLTSDWIFDDGTTIHLTERQLLQTQPNQDDEGELLSRYDVTKNGGKLSTSYTLFIQHATGGIIRTTSSSCKQVSLPDIWLRLHELDDPDFNHVTPDIKIDDWTPKPVGMYGIIALWKQAELSSSLEFIYGTQSWKMTLGNNKVVVLFSFTINEETNKPELSTIEIDTSKVSDMFDNSVKKIVINSIKFEPISPNILTFVLPSHCNSKVTNENHYPSPKFRFPAFQDKFNGFPVSVAFKFQYQITAIIDGSRKLCGAKEVYSPYSGNGLFSLRCFDGGNVNLWIHSNEYTYLDWKKDCRLVGNISQIFGIEDWLFQGNKLLRAESTNFLLANAWQLISARADPTYPADLEDEVELSVKSRQHILNAKYQPILVDWIIRNPQNGNSIKFTFIHHSSSSMPDLQGVYFLTEKSEAILQMRIISIENKLEDVSMPVKCMGDMNFPNLSESITDRERQISHLRSEFSSDLPFEVQSVGQLFMVDEWLYLGDGSHFTYRLTTRGLNEEKDYLVISESGELFDLSRKASSTPKCETIDLGPGINDTSIWLNDRLIGPLWVWLMASKFPHQMKVNPSVIKITLRDIVIDSELEIATQMKSYVWDVNSRDHQHEFKLQFNLIFEELTSWFELDQMYLSQSFQQPKLEPQQVVIQAVSFVSISMEDTSIKQRLSIPKGRGCRRNAYARLNGLAKLRDVMVFQDTSPASFRYYSYLKLAENNTSNFVIQPVIHEGSVSFCPTIWYTLPIGSVKVQHERTVPLNGSQPTSSRQIVSQKARTKGGSEQTNTVDEVTGECLIKRDANRDELLRLAFELPVEQQIVLDLKFIQKLLATKGFDLLQSIEDKSRVYESSWMEVNLTSTLSGPVVITRTFDTDDEDTKNMVYGGLWYQSSVGIEILWPNKGLLYLKIFELKFKDCYDILKDDADPEECIQSSQFSPKQKIHYYKFRIAQSGPKISSQAMSNLISSIKINVKDSLLSHFNGRLIPVQLGRATISLDEEETLTVELRLSLIDPPEPIEYFEKLENQMLDSRQPVKVKPLENEYACSDWCSSNGCRAFSYCSSDRLCRIAEKFERNENNTTGCCDLSTGQSCRFWKASDGIVRESVRSLMAELEENVANDRFSINWSAFGTRLKVVGIKELKGLLDEEDEQEQRAGNGVDEEEVFLLMKPNAKVILTEDNSNQFKEARELKLSDCMRSCSKQACQLFSYCSDDQTCTMLVNLDSYSSYVANVEATLKSDKCSTYSEDFVLNYQHFSQTSEPSSSKLDFSDISLQDCAARCDLNGGQPFTCVAFDYCQTISNHGDKSESKCYLQAMHLIMEDFDETIFSELKPQTSPDEDEDKSTSCSHYSSTFMRDFVPHLNRKFVNHGLITHGLNLQKCALICRAHSETCLAFEHCHTDMSKHDTCFVHHLAEQEAGGTNKEEQSLSSTTYNNSNKLIEELIHSDTCSVYEYRRRALKQETLQVMIEDKVATLTLYQKAGLLALETAVKAIFALLFGVIIQLGYIRLQTRL